MLIISYFRLAFNYELPKYLLPNVKDEVQTEAVKQLINRAVGAEQANRFQVKVDSKENFRSFKLLKTKDENKLKIYGSDGVSVAKGLQHYFKYYLNQDINWLRKRVDLKNIELPIVNISSTSASTFIYYQNVCTWSYSFAWWDWSTWRQHIDWMALMGVSLTIAPIQEQIWFDLYTELGMNENEISEHLAGPAFQAWQRMGNIRAWAGPLPSNYRRMQFSLQKRIISAQRELGMTVALPAFAGHVPVSIKRLFPNASYTTVERWNNFPDRYCCPLFLVPNDELFAAIAGAFLQRIIAAYGTNHIYFADPYNEVNPSEATAHYLNMTAIHIYSSMSAVDTQAIWLLQGWMFVKNPFWSDPLIAAFLKAPPQGRLLVLDLQSEQFPQYERTHSFHGQPFIWCMLHNFGGTLGMHGSSDIVNLQIEYARQMPNSTLVGVGITPEGIHQNYVMYALALERAWSIEQLNLQSWFEKYTRARYEISDERIIQSWQLLRRSVYAFQGLQRLRGKYVLTRRPALNLNIWLWYDASDITEALSLVLDTNITMPTAETARRIFAHDVVDLTRQWLQLKADQLYVNLRDAFKKRELQRFQTLSQQLLLVFDDLDTILATDAEFLLGIWLRDAKKMAGSLAEKPLYAFNALNQITTWGPEGQILDYANKQWSGIMKDYYKPRWQLFTDDLEQCIKEARSFNASAFREQVSQQIEWPFSWKQTAYPAEPKGESLDIARNIFRKWTEKYHEHNFSQYLKLEVKIITTILT